MKDMDGRVFLYRGFSVGVEGMLTRPFPQVLDGQASVALPIVGGYTSARVENYRLRELLSFKEARTYTTGSQSSDGAYNTVVSSTIEGLNILDIVTCDAVSGISPRITMSYPASVAAETVEMSLATNSLSPSERRISTK